MPNDSPRIYVQKPNNAKQRRKKYLWILISGFILVVGFLISVIAGWEPFKKIIHSLKENYEDEKFVKGKLISPKIDRRFSKSIVDEYENKFIDTARKRYPNVIGIKLNSQAVNDSIIFHLGNYRVIYNVDSVYKGVDICSVKVNPVVGMISPHKIIFGIKNYRLFVNTEFNDLDHEETIGIIEFNHWKIFKDNMLLFQNDDHRLEVRDKKNRIVFGINYTGGFDVYLTGYFIDDDAVFVMKNTGYHSLKFTVIPKSAGYLNLANTMIDSIETLFPESYR